MAQSGNKLSGTTDVQQLALLRQMIIDTFGVKKEVNYDAVYEDVVECMEYEKNVKYFLFATISALVQ